MKPLPPAIESKVQRILDSEARRIFEERNRDSFSTELTNSAARQYLRADRRHRLYTLHAETCPGKDFR